MGISQIGGSTSSGSSSSNVIYGPLPTSNLTCASSVFTADTALAQTITGSRFIVQYDFTNDLQPCNVGAQLAWTGATIQRLSATLSSPGAGTFFPPSEQAFAFYPPTSPAQITSASGNNGGYFARMTVIWNVVLSASGTLTITPGIYNGGGSNGTTTATVGYRRITTTIVAA